MPQPAIDIHKQPYVEFVDLLIEHRKRGWGLTGKTYVPIQDIVSLEVTDSMLEHFCNVLFSDQVIDTHSPTERNLTCEEEQGGIPCKVFNCKMSSDEILMYKRKLRRPDLSGARQPPMSIPANSWETCIIRFITDREVHITTGRTPDISADFVTLGLVDGRTAGQRPTPNRAWLFLLKLALANGHIQYGGPIPPQDQTDKKKLAASLKQIFQLGEDPFFPQAEAGGYKIKCTLIPPVAEEPCTAPPDIYAYMPDD